MTGISEEEEKSEEYSAPEEMDIDPDSDPKTVFSDGSSSDEDEESTEEERSIEHPSPVREYNRQIRESDGFNATILPVYSKDHDDLVVMANKALHHYNLYNADSLNSNWENRTGVPFNFEKIESATTVGDMIFLITFQARGANGSIRTFRGRVWNGKGKNKVLFVEIMPQVELQGLARYDLVVMATEALDKYNNDNNIRKKGVPYKFRQIKKATSRGKIYLITFQARGANAITRTFQAKVWNFMGKKKIQFIRIKPYWRSRKEEKEELVEMGTK